MKLDELNRLAAERTRSMWRSPLRGPWLTSVLGAVLLAGLPLVAITGLLDYVAYGPAFGQAFPLAVGPFHLPLFDWPTRPSWLFRLPQGLHVGLGLVLIPVVLAKLWSVVPRLFAWPPVRSVGHAVERLTLVPLVGGALFEIVTGVLNIQYDYVFGFDFYTAHYWGAWVFIFGLLAHLAVKLPAMVRGLRSRSLRAELRTPLARTRPETPDSPDGLVAAAPTPPTMSRRGLLALIGGGSLLVAGLTVGQTVDALRPLAVLLPRGRVPAPGDFPVNRTAVAAGIIRADLGNWRLTLTGGPSPVTLDAALAGLPRHTAELPIACVEGWSSTQTWTGVRLADLAARAGVAAPVAALVRSMERGGPFSSAWLTADQVLDPDALLATEVNGAPLTLDHGFPARVIVPALPGVHCTKWVGSIEFRAVA
ncbi:molybdopterin-dependent oxidoreductase [Pseudonocardia eucalypti]|uniref:Molybdopterin-dependent oxidoreductase n=1 Tax=Pseudonocardia eucalypti TaxID=648755 RepID=A0ABP9QLZ1_9PSEU|nr:DMSO/TMAO reductase YedYZ molybdopterin-dependent catalytic subunit [Pseudonocardia eucalypti]